MQLSLGSKEGNNWVGLCGLLESDDAHFLIWRGVITWWKFIKLYTGKVLCILLLAIPFSRRSSRSRSWTQAPCIASGFFTIRATREALCMYTSVKYYWRNLGLSFSVSLYYSIEKKKKKKTVIILKYIKPL